MLQNYPAAEGLRTKPVRNADKLRFLFLGQHATGSMSFSPGMSSVPRVMSKMKSIRIDTEEGTGDSDDADEEQVQEVEGQGVAREAGEESHSPPRSSRKSKSDGVSNDFTKRQQNETTAELIRLMHAKYTREVEQKSEPSIYDKVASRLEELPQVTERGPPFMFQVMDTIKRNAEMDFFLSFKTKELAWCYIVNRLTAEGMGYLL